MSELKARLLKRRVKTVPVKCLDAEVSVRALSMRELRELSRLPDDQFASALLQAAVLDETGAPMFSSASEADELDNELATELLGAVNSVNQLKVDNAAKN